MPSSLKGYTLVTTAELSYLATIVHEELPVDIELVEVRGEDIDSVGGDLHIALADDGLRLDLVHMVLDHVGTKVLRALSYTLGPVHHTEQV